MEFEKEALKNIKKSIVKNINELGKKNDLTPAETKAMLDGFDAYDRACVELEECEMKENGDEAMKASYRSYSMHGDEPFRRYEIKSYGDRPSMRSYGHNRMMPRYSGDYGVEGWYRSGDDRMYQAGVYPLEREAMMYPERGGMSAAEHREYSRHSVADRVISIIEKSSDLGQMTPFEQDEVRRIISIIRTAE
jgi:uncharacterized membrane protein